MTKRSIGLWISLSIVLIAIIIVFLLWGNISKYLTNKTLDLLGKNLKVKITAQEIKGSIFTGVVLSDVSIKFSSGDSFHTQTIKANYNLFNIIFKRQNNLSNLILINPKIYLSAIGGRSPLQRTKSAKLYRQVKSTKRIPPLTLPLLLINHLQIDNGQIYSNEQVILDSLFIIANINLKINQGRCLITKSSFFLPGYNLQIQNLQSDIQGFQDQLVIKKLKIKSAKSEFNLTGKIDLVNLIIQADFQKCLLSLQEIGHNQGIVNLDGNLAFSFGPETGQLTNITGEIKYANSDIKLSNIIIPDGTGLLIIKDKTIKLNYNQVNFETANPSTLVINCQYELTPLTYQGAAEFTNLLLPVRNIQLPFDGKLTFRGNDLAGVELNLTASSKTPAIESISAQGSIKNGRILFEKVRLKDRTSILGLHGYYLPSSNKSFDISYQFSNFSLSLASEIFNAFGHKHIALTGFINGTGKIFSKDNQIASFGELTIRNGSLPQLQCSRFHSTYNLENITKLSGTASINLEDIIWKNNQLDQLSLSLQNGDFIIQALNWKGNRVYANGKFTINHKGADCFVDSFQIISVKHIIRNNQPFGFGITKNRFYIENLVLAIGKGLVAVDLSTNSTGPANINLSCQQLELQDISDILQLPITIKGLINIDVLNQPNQDCYTIACSGQELNIPTALFKKSQPINASNQSEINLKYLEGAGLLTNSRLKINKLNLVYQSDTSKITGVIDINREAFLKSNLDLTVLFNDPGVWVFFFLKNILDVQEGNINGQGSITGTLENPTLTGAVTVTDAKIFIVATKTQCDKVNARLSFDKQKIILTDLVGNAGTGKIRALGYTEICGFRQVDTLSYNIEFTNAPLRPQKEVFAIANGNLTIDYKPESPLALTGNIIINEALLTYEFASGSGIANGKQPINLNLRIKGDRSIWLRNRSLDAELAVDLNIFHDGKNTIYSGKLNALQGSFYYLDHIFKLTNGQLIFDNISELNPNLDITAQLPTRPIRIQTGTEPITIILSLTGRLQEPTFTFSAEPPLLSQEDIISYLSFNVTWQQMTAAESREIFTTALSEKLLGYFERELSQRLRSFIALDYLMIESGLISGTSTKVTVGKYLGRNLYFTYQYNITGTTSDIFRIEYYITKSNEIIGERDIDGRYNLKYLYKIRY